MFRSNLHPSTVSTMTTIAMQRLTIRALSPGIPSHTLTFFVGCYWIDPTGDDHAEPDGCGSAGS